MKQQQHLFTNKMLRALLVPIIMEQLLNALMGTVDTMMVSNVGSAAISAVSLVDSINVLIIQAFSALAAGGTIICTQYLGQKNHEMANKSARQALFIITAISVFIVVLGLAFRAPLLSFIFGKVDADVMKNSMVYFFYTVLSYPFIALYDAAPFLFFLLFELHYFQRSFLFPFLMKGKNRMPLAIMLMGVVFNVLNGLMQGEWLFYLAPEGLYTDAWLSTPSFWLGIILFFIGIGINLHSDSVIRHLRKPGDTRHYLPQKGMYRYVTSGNYFGELVEWIGFAVLTCSPAAWVFVLWTFANLAPRANSIRNRYREEFGKDAVGKKKRMIPFIY